ncbi:Deoxyhypusine synthase [Tieghemiomyces parasiticus]|uniref:deoxyhypusine synthase n=1 Tax=Tieghemiomyces parasiticus TaxID=78921 RepID=A0A9W8AFR6_9FUNG|nr:Deoxyhypusine synthase [Tieghemiomyces parasiticus]
MSDSSHSSYTAKDPAAEHALPTTVADAVLVKSDSMPVDSTVIRGYDFNEGVHYPALFQSYLRTGFQATHLGRAIEIVNRMRTWRLSDDPITDDETEEYRDPAVRAQTRCKIFLGFTSNLISSGLRETFRYLLQHRMVDCVVTTAGGIEEDFIKCLGPTYAGSFSLPGADLRKRGLNRIGNLLVPNDNYCKFEDWVMPILDQMLKEQKEEGIVWSPSKIIRRLGKEINNEESVYYWAYKNDIPIYCPAITDGSLGDMIYFHTYRNPGLVIDLVSDIRAMNNEAVFAKKTGVIILGGGVVKHHISNANLMVSDVAKGCQAGIGASKVRVAS